MIFTPVVLSVLYMRSAGSFFTDRNENLDEEMKTI